MLRLAPTSIPLTRGEIAQYEIRREERRHEEQLSNSKRQASAAYTNSSIRSGQPHVWAGPKRFVTYHDETAPRRSLAEENGPDSDYPDSICSKTSYHDEDTLSANEDVSGSDASSARPSSARRDSVLSTDHKYQQPPTTFTTNQRSADKADLYPNFDGTRDELDFDATEALLGLRLVNNRRERSHSSKNYSCRVSHGRSLSDPLEAGILYDALDHSLHSRIEQTQRANMGGLSSSGTRQGSGATDELGSHDTIVHEIHRKPLPSKHSRHHSMPIPLHQASPTVSQSNSLYEDHHVHEHEEDSAISKCLRNSSSPLDQLVESAAALRMSSPLPSTPSSHTSKSSIARRIRFPSFRDDADSRIHTGLRGGSAEESMEQSTITKRDASSPVYQSRQATHSAAYPQPRLRRVLPLIAYAEGPSWAPGRSMRAEFSLPQEIRPPSIEHRQVHRPAIRRRPLPNANQENEDEMAPLYAEREAWIARQLAPTQGRLEATPSPEGRLERLMR